MKKMIKISLWMVCLVVTVCLTLSAGIPAASAAYPEKSITLVCHSKPGSSVDLMARAVSKLAPKYLGQPVAVMTKAGGGGMIASAYAKKQPADGYTLVTATRGWACAMASERAKHLSADDFIAVSRLIGEHLMFAVNANRPYDTWAKFVDYANKHPKTIKVAVPYLGYLHHTIWLMVKKRAGITTIDVPHEGGRPCIVSAMGGHDDAVFNNPSALKGALKEKKLIALFSSGPERMEEFPNVPTLKEVGVDMVELHWRGIIAPAGVPQERVQFLAAGLEKMCEEPEWKEVLKNFTWQPGFMPPEEFDPYLRGQIRSFRETLIAEGLMKK